MAFFPWLVSMGVGGCLCETDGWAAVMCLTTWWLLPVVWSQQFEFLSFRYMANTETYLKNVALKHMPPNLQVVDLLRSGERSTPFSDISSGALE